MQLRLMVNNTSELEGSAASSAVFDKSGGVIGSAENADWVLVDRQGTILPKHLHVCHIDGQFCLEAGKGASAYVNGSKAAIMAGEPFQVADGDEIRIGVFTLSVYVSLEAADKEMAAHRGEAWARRFAPVGILVGDEQARQISSETLFETQVMQRDNSVLHERLNQANRRDPIEMMEERQASRSSHEKDPLAVFEREQKIEARAMMTSKVGEVLNIEPEEAHYVELPDDLQPGSSYVPIPQARSFDEGEMDDNPPSSPLKGTMKRPVHNEDVDSYLEMLAQAARTPGKGANETYHAPNAGLDSEDWRRVADVSHRDAYLGEIMDEDLIEGESGAPIDHVVLRPLAKALGLNIAQMSEPQANRLAADIGAALKAAISGLMAAHQREMSSKSHLAETHLHAIEDNPLRLEISVEEAVRDLFLVQSPVHLSAPAAITESLTLLRHHRAASDAATEAALDAVLQALSPLSLARRFMKYKGHAPRAGNLDAWHWTMYQHYYAEMRSHQQGGLSRMFWEVHRQVYDREMRSRTQTIENN